MKKNALLLGLFVFCFVVPVLIFAADAPVRPYKFQGNIRVIDIQWADPMAPISGATSTFEGRCSEPSDYIITWRMVGEATHLGRITGTAEHCTQLHLTATGPSNVTYGDGRFSITAADDDTLIGTYGQGTSGGDASGLWFHDFWTITGGTGRFTEARGGGEEGGSFNDFIALLNGAPAGMWMEGTIAYKASDRR